MVSSDNTNPNYKSVENPAYYGTMLKKRWTSYFSLVFYSFIYIRKTANNCDL